MLLCFLLCALICFTDQTIGLLMEGSEVQQLPYEDIQHICMQWGHSAAFLLTYVSYINHGIFDYLSSDFSPMHNHLFPGLMLPYLYWIYRNTVVLIVSPQKPFNTHSCRNTDNISLNVEHDKIYRTFHYTAIRLFVGVYDLIELWPLVICDGNLHKYQIYVRWSDFEIDLSNMPEQQLPRRIFNWDS